MKLFELTGIKVYYNKTVEEIKDLMVSGGKFIKVGEGYFAVVFTHESNVAYKFWAYDPEYEKFIQICNKHKDNPFFPKFLSPVKTITSFFKRSEIFPDKIKYIKMEILKPYHQQKISGEATLRDFINYFIDVGQYKNDKDIPKIIEAMFNSLPMLRKGAVRTEELSKQITDLYEALFIIRNELDLDINDLHSENYMLRGNQVVITDPVAENSTIMAMREIRELMNDPDALTVTGKKK